MGEDDSLPISHYLVIKNLVVCYSIKNKSTKLYSFLK